jgi:DNA-binding IclR family transcriptional regulator
MRTSSVPGHSRDQHTVQVGSPSASPRSLMSRFAAILDTFRFGDRHSMVEIARMTGLPVSTTHRLVTDMAAWQILHRMPDGEYRIGLAVQMVKADTTYLPTLHELAPQVLTDLANATHRRARLGVLMDDRVSYAERRPGADPASAFCPSATLPAHATALGKALVAFAPAGVATSVSRRMTAYTSRTLTSPDRLLAVLTSVRLTQLAIACGELVAGDLTVATPVFGGDGKVVAALELQVHDLHHDLRLCTSTLIVASRGLSRALVAGASVRERADLPPELSLHAGLASGT